jgi:YD repeat-containing protein
VAPHADTAYQYDASRRVTQEVVQGAGTSLNMGDGRGTYTFSYSPNPANPTPGINTWAYRTEEGLPDHTTNIVYTNAYGEVMLKDHREGSQPGSTQDWVDFYKFQDGTGRVLLHAHPSAIQRDPMTGMSFDDTHSDLMGFDSANHSPYLKDTDGLIETTEYYTATSQTIGDNTSGGVAGYVKGTNLQNGQRGSPVPQSGTQYFAHRVSGGATVYPVATTTAYGLDYGTLPDYSDRDPRTTRYAYTWYPGSTRMQSETMTQPPIPTGQDGPASDNHDTAHADTSNTFYDTYGRPTWHRDGDGHVDYTAYDPATGAEIKTITDVDYNSLTPGEQTSFNATGWTPQPAGGLHLITIMQVDSLGRTTARFEPNSTFDVNGHPVDPFVTYTVYKDPSHEIRTYPGWVPNVGPTGPVEVTREDRLHSPSYTETLTMPYTVTPVPAMPDGTEAIANVQTLSRTFTSPGGQVVYTDAYFNLTGQTYTSQTPTIGTEGTNYFRTRYDYDSRGRQSRVQSPLGTVTLTGYDGLDRVVSTSVGTTDANAVLVTHTDYNAAGWVADTIDPRDLMSTTGYDLLGRTTKTVEDYTDGTPTAETNMTTEYRYDGDNHLMLYQQDLPSNGSQHTQYNYGVRRGDGGNLISSADLLASVQYPDKMSGMPSTNQADQESFSYDALGEAVGFTDRNQTAHTYTFDLLGRQTSDQVMLSSNPPPNTVVDGAVLRLDTAYDGQGNAYRFTSYNSATAADTAHIVNQVQRQYNGLGQLTAEFQSHVAGQGVVAGTPAVRYTYSEMTTDSGAYADHSSSRVV